MCRIKRSVFCLAAILITALIVSTSQGAEFVEGEVIVTFKPAINLESAKRTLDGRALPMARRFAYLSDRRHQQMGLVRVKGRSTAQLIEELKRDPSIETVEPNYIRRLTAQLPDDTLFSDLWALQNTGQTVNGYAGTPGSDIKFIPAWNLSRPSTGEVVIAVIDSGMDFRHPDIVSNMWTNAAENPTNNIDDDLNGYVDDY
jgi:hypothetical protein